jgi:hypothetical protein
MYNAGWRGPKCYFGMPGFVNHDVRIYPPALATMAKMASNDRLDE